MTKREFYEAVINGTMNTDVQEFANEELSKMNARNAHRRETPSKTQVANAELDEQVFGYFTTNEITEPIAASVIAGVFDITPSKASASCGRLADSGRFKVTQIKSPSKSGGKIKGYSLA